MNYVSHITDISITRIIKSFLLQKNVYVATFFRLGSWVVGVMIHLSFLLIGTLPLLHLGSLYGCVE